MSNVQHKLMQHLKTKYEFNISNTTWARNTWVNYTFKNITVKEVKRGGFTACDIIKKVLFLHSGTNE